MTRSRYADNKYEACEFTGGTEIAPTTTRQRDGTNSRVSAPQCPEIYWLKTADLPEVLDGPTQIKLQSLLYAASCAGCRRPRRYPEHPKPRNLQFRGSTSARLLTAREESPK